MNKIVIDIPKETYEALVINQYCGSKSNLENIIINGKPLPEHHGRLIDADMLEYTCNADECGMLTGCNNCQYHIVTEYEIDNASTIIEGSDPE